MVERGVIVGVVVALVVMVFFFLGGVFEIGEELFLGYLLVWIWIRVLGLFFVVIIVDFLFFFLYV